MRRGFTLIELLVVISIIMILMGLLLPALGMVRRQQKLTSTRLLLANVSLSLSHYLGDYGVLGEVRDEAGSDFRDKPLEFLVARKVRAREDPYLELKPTQIGAMAGGLAAADKAEVLLDAFSLPVRFEITNKHAKGRPTGGACDYTDKIVVTATCGTPDEPADDVVATYDHGNKEWTTSGR